MTDLTYRDRARSILDEKKVLGFEPAPPFLGDDQELFKVGLAGLLSLLAYGESDLVESMLTDAAQQLEALFYLIAALDLNPQELRDRTERIRMKLLAAISVNHRYREGCIEAVALEIEAAATVGAARVEASALQCAALAATPIKARRSR